MGEEEARPPDEVNLAAGAAEDQDAARDQEEGAVRLAFEAGDVEKLWTAAPPSDGSAGSAEQREALGQLLGLGADPSRAFQDEVVCGFFTDLLVFTRSMCISAKKVAVFADIMLRVLTGMHERSIATTRIGEPRSVSESFLHFKSLMLERSVAVNAEFGIFTLPEVRQLTTFASDNLFQHFVLYQSVLVCPHERSVKKSYVTLQRPRPPQPLVKAKMKPKAKAAAVKEEQDLSKTMDPMSAGHGVSSDTAAEAEAKTLLENGIGGPTPNADADGDAGAADAQLSVDEHHARVTSAATHQLAEAIVEHDKPFDGKLPP